jgi:Fe-S-cluster containining protein
MVDTVHFACTACGKCCTEPPEMTVLEATRLGDVFIPALVYRLTSLPKDDNEAAFASLSPHRHFKDMDGRELVARLRESSAVRSAGAVVSEPGWEHHISLTARAWTYPIAWCPALDADHKRCTIHERRPATCRTVPIRYDVPEGLLVRAFRGMVDEGKASSEPFECDTSDAAPVLLKDGACVDPDYAAARAAGLEAAVKEKELAGRILSSPLLPPVREVYGLLRRGQLVSVSFHGALASAHDLGLIDDEGLKAFCNAQVGLLEREITAALARHDKAERDVTTRFRTLVDAYRSMLQYNAARKAPAAV